MTIRKAERKERALLSSRSPQSRSTEGAGSPLLQEQHRAPCSMNLQTWIHPTCQELWQGKNHSSSFSFHLLFTNTSWVSLGLMHFCSSFAKEAPLTFLHGLMCCCIAVSWNILVKLERAEIAGGNALIRTRSGLIKYNNY